MLALKYQEAVAFGQTTTVDVDFGHRIVGNHDWTTEDGVENWKLVFDDGSVLHTLRKYDEMAGPVYSATVGYEDISVEKRHIDEGHKSHKFLCPVALAVKEIFPKHHVTVSPDSISVRHYEASLKERICFVTPPLARAFINDFDHGISVGPITFPMEVEHEG